MLVFESKNGKVYFDSPNVTNWPATFFIKIYNDVCFYVSQ